MVVVPVACAGTSGHATLGEVTGEAAIVGVGVGVSVGFSAGVGVGVGFCETIIMNIVGAVVW